MTITTTEQRVKKLVSIYTYKYRNDLHPEYAARIIVEGILNQYKTQKEFIDQLLDWEIEDATMEVR